MKFDSATALPAKIRLYCIEAGTLQEQVDAYVEGIRIGGRPCSQAFSTGDILDVPVHYFPLVTLPNKVRFVSGSAEIATPLMISSVEDVSVMLGHGEVRVENVTLENSLLRGTIINTTNSLHAATAYIKINGQVVRAAVVESSKGRDEGGAAARFAVPIRPSDLVETGLLIDLFVTGLDYPVANFTYVRSELGSETRRLIELDEKVRQLQRSSLLQVEMLRTDLDRRLQVQQERIDSFIEYAMSIMMDKLAGPMESIDPAAFLDALQQLRSSGAAASIHLPLPSPPSSANLSLDASAFAFGWYDVEANEDGQFRWMGQTALIRNPFIGRPLSRVELTVSQVYGTHEPVLRARLDEQDLISSVRKDGTRFLVKLEPPDDRHITGESMQLESLVTGCPGIDLGTSDQRILSVAITRVKIFYDAVTEIAA